MLAEKLGVATTTVYRHINYKKAMKPHNANAIDKATGGVVPGWQLAGLANPKRKNL